MILRHWKLIMRYNEAVKLAMATRQAEVVEMYQPMTDAMRQCQEAITECMEAMLVELKRDHSLVSTSP
jgi:DNA excision repair protein ERCC-4